MSAYAALNGTLRIISGTISIPYYGIWVAEVVLALTAEIPAMVTLGVGNLSLKGAVYRSASYAGARSALIVGGAGGWNDDVGPASYQNDSGILLSLILGDVAKAVGETVQVATDTSVGTAFVRRRGPAVNVMRQLAGDTWWMREDGTTIVGPHPTTTITSPFTLESFSGAKGSYSIASESPGDWMPGAIFQAPTMGDPRTVSYVQHTLENDGTVRTEVLATS